MTHVVRVSATACLAVGLGILGRADDVNVSLDASVTYQTIRGWSCNPHYVDGSREQREQVIAEAVDSLGITRVRWQQPNGNRSRVYRWELENDNGDPNSTDLSRLNTACADQYVGAYLLPFKRRVEANGDPFELWLSPSFFRGGSTGDVPAFLLHSPGEYAEYATSFICYLRDTYGVTVNHYAICNEAGNDNAFTPAVVAEFTKVLGKRLDKLGLPAKGQFSDGINAQVAWRYIQHAKDDPDVWKYVDVLSYHWYGGKNHEYLPKIRDFASQHGMSTAQSEFMHLKIDHLYDDLTLGGVSYWSIYGLGGPGSRGQNFWFRQDDTSFQRGKQFWNFRQVMRYVRPGAVRIACASDDAALRPLAFIQAGHATVVLINTSAPQRARSVSVGGMPAGPYGVCRCVNASPYEELGVSVVGADGTLALTVPANTVLTVYPHPATNLPPTPTNWEATPTLLKVPASRITLRAAAQDPERDPLAYSWTVTGQPAGAKAVLANSEAATTDVSGLALPGRYTFTVAISDGANTVRRDVLLNVFDGNQPPRLVDAHNRIPVIVTLPQDNTSLRGGGFDLEGDKLSFRWSVVGQPPGSDVRIETDAKGQPKLAHITKPGKHVLRFEGSDGPHTVAEELTIPVYPVNQAPAIGAIDAVPARLVSPQSETTLSAGTGDPDGDTISHWWRIVRKPAGAEPVLDAAGKARTKVTGLTVAGAYVFELTVVDRTKVTSAKTTVVVGLGAAGTDAGGKGGGIGVGAGLGTSGRSSTPGNAGKGGKPVTAGNVGTGGGFSVVPDAVGANATGDADRSWDPPAQRSRDDRVAIARGTVTGTVLAKGRAWVEIRSTTGGTERYIPEWRGGMPRNGGGPDRQITGAIAGLNIGDTVTVRWYVTDHVRIASISKQP